jgi:hypothetical protein
MAVPRRSTPYPLLLEAAYWRRRLAQMDSVQRALLILPRADLSNPLSEVVEWRLRAHDGLRLWGLRAQSPFFPEPKGACIRQVSSCDLPTIDDEAVGDGHVDFILQTPVGRKLEDRVLDLLRTYQMAVHYSGIDADKVRFAPTSAGDTPDEVMIATQLVAQGIF